MNKIAMTLAIGLSLVGCKKKTATVTEGSGSAMMTGSADGSAGSGSAMMAGSGSGSGSAAGSAADMSKPKTGAELVELYKACTAQLTAGKFDDFASNCVDESYVGHEMGHETKKSEVVGFFTSMRTAFPDLKLEPQFIFVNGRNVFGAILETGTQSGVMKMPGMPDVPATNKKIGLMMFHRLTFNDANKATEEWAFIDPGTMMSQLGLTPKEAGPHRAAMEKGMDGAPVVVIGTDDAKEKANLELIKKSNDAFSAHKIADMMALATDDAVESDQASEKDTVGKKEIEKGAKMFMDSFSDGKLSNPTMFAAGDFVVTLATFEGTNDHDMGPMKKTGKKVSVPVAEVSQIKDGKITHFWRFYSSFDFAMQLGMMPAPGAAPAAGSGSAAPAAGSGSGSGSAAPAAGSAK